MSNPTETGVHDKNFHARKGFVINVEYADTVMHLQIFNQG